MYGVSGFVPDDDDDDGDGYCRVSGRAGWDIKRRGRWTKNSTVYRQALFKSGKAVL